MYFQQNTTAEQRACARVAYHPVVNKKIRAFKISHSAWGLQLQRYAEKYRIHKEKKAARQSKLSQQELGDEIEQSSALETEANRDAAANANEKQTTLGEDETISDSNESSEKSALHSDTDNVSKEELNQHLQKRNSGNMLIKNTSSDEPVDEIVSESECIVSKKERKESPTTKNTSDLESNSVQQKLSGSVKVKTKAKISHEIAETLTKKGKKKMASLKSSNTQKSAKELGNKERENISRVESKNFEKVTVNPSVLPAPFTKEMELKPFDLTALNTEGELELSTDKYSEKGEYSHDPHDGEIPSFLFGSTEDNSKSSTKRKKDVFFAGYSDRESDGQEDEDAQTSDDGDDRGGRGSAAKSRQFATAAERYRRQGDRGGHAVPKHTMSNRQSTTGAW